MRYVILNLFVPCILIFPHIFAQTEPVSVTVPFVLDHNRILVEGEIQRKDGSWRKVTLWVDNGNPAWCMSESLARDIGIDLTGKKGNFIAELTPGLRFGGKSLSTDSVEAHVMTQPFWLFSAMHNDANLPSSVLMKYHAIIDYPNRTLTLADPGTITPQGNRHPVNIHPKTGIVQMNGSINGDSMSFAIDIGASYSFISGEIIFGYSQQYPAWQVMTGALGCANMWGWWPSGEETLQVMRVPEIILGTEKLNGVGVVGAPRIAPNGPSLGQWYSRKTALPVAGFLGSNAFESCRVEIDYFNSAIYLMQSQPTSDDDMCLVGLTLRPEEDGSYSVLGVSLNEGKPGVEEVQTGDKLLQIGNFKTRGATMGTVIDALRGKPGDTKILMLERCGKSFIVNAQVLRYL